MFLGCWTCCTPFLPSCKFLHRFFLSFHGKFSYVSFLPTVWNFLFFFLSFLPTSFSSVLHLPSSHLSRPSSVRSPIIPSQLGDTPSYTIGMNEELLRALRHHVVHGNRAPGERRNTHPHLVRPFRHPRTAPRHQHPVHAKPFGFVEAWPTEGRPLPPNHFTRSHPNFETGVRRAGNDELYPAFMYK